MSVARKAVAAPARVDAVFIRKSTTSQDEQAQVANVTAMLRERGVYVPERYWFTCTVARAKVQGNAEFRKLMSLVEAYKVGTVYVESLDRWGTGDIPELYTLLGTLSDHGTRLFDLRDGADLTATDDATQFKTFLGGFKSKKERQDIAFRSLRTRANLFKDSGSWPTGQAPYGYAKECRTADGALLWRWVPVGGHRGDLYHPDADGRLSLTRGDCPSPRKTKGARERTVLVPGRADYVRAVRLVYDLWVNHGLSRRAIAARLNGEGLTFNGRPFRYGNVTDILKNPAYGGSIHFGKKKTAKHYTFNPKDGTPVVADGRDRGPRAVDERLVKEGTHEALVDRETWERAQAKLGRAEADNRAHRRCHPPRNPTAYLKRLLTCGHCGRPLTARTREGGGVVYMCSTHSKSRWNGQTLACFGYRLDHATAERLILDKVQEMGQEAEALSGGEARSNLERRLDRLGQDDAADRERWRRRYEEGVSAFADWLLHHSGIDPQVGRRLTRRLLLMAHAYYDWGDVAYIRPGRPGPDALERIPPAFQRLKDAIQESERLAVETARAKLAALQAELAAYTRRWVLATDETIQSVMKADMDWLAAEIRKWQERTVPLGERFARLAEAERERERERRALLNEWPSLEASARGEALARLFSEVRLFWERTWHPAPERPVRPRKTSRAGRWSYTLLPERTQWKFASADLNDSW
jgi:DNA invertase Pin-like site-specific DNA recombinase